MSTWEYKEGPFVCTVTEVQWADVETVGWWVFKRERRNKRYRFDWQVRYRASDRVLKSGSALTRYGADKGCDDAMAEVREKTPYFVTVIGTCSKCGDLMYGGEGYESSSVNGNRVLVCLLNGCDTDAPVSR
jgi:hypothetical protein